MSAGTHSIVSISSHALIALARSARKLSLDPNKIRAKMSDTMQSRFKGRGMEYDESRPYQPGDDVRHLDWRVTARSMMTYTKTFQEERERPVFLWADQRPSMFFATRGKFKSVLAAEISALLGWTAAHRGDRIGGAVFFGDGYNEVKPMRGRIGMLQFIHQLIKHPDISETDNQSNMPLNKLARLVRPGSLVILVSDFRSFDITAQNSLRKLATHNELIMIQIYDTIEKELPPPGDYKVTYQGNEVQFTSQDKTLKQQYHQRFEQRTKQIAQLAKKLGAYYLTCCTDDNPLTVLQKIFSTKHQ